MREYTAASDSVTARNLSHSFTERTRQLCPLRLCPDTERMAHSMPQLGSRKISLDVRLFPRTRPWDDSALDVVDLKICWIAGKGFGCLKDSIQFGLGCHAARQLMTPLCRFGVRLTELRVCQLLKRACYIIHKYL